MLTGGDGEMIAYVRSTVTLLNKTFYGYSFRCGVIVENV